MQRFVLALLQKARPWTDADRYTYAHRNDDPTLWDTTMLREDLESHLEPPFWPTKPAIAEIPSPVADYDWGYCAMRNLETTIGDRKLVGWNIAYASDTFRQADRLASVAELLRSHRFTQLPTLPRHRQAKKLHRRHRLGSDEPCRRPKLRHREPAIFRFKLRPDDPRCPTNRRIIAPQAIRPEPGRSSKTPDVIRFFNHPKAVK